MEAEHRWRIGIETERTLIVVRRNVNRGWGEKSGPEVELLGKKAAAQMFAIAVGQIETKTASELHLAQVKDGLVIYLKSLLRFLQSVVIENGAGKGPGASKR